MVGPEAVGRTAFLGPVDEATEPAIPVILKQYYLSCLAHASYLVADETTRVAAVVDPQRDIDQYVQDAERQSLEIRHVFLTHFHADFVAGHLELAQRAGATIHLGARAEAEYAFEPLADGAEVELGPDVRLRVLETPGHSPESISILVSDRAATVEPAAVLTGDTLFIGDVGRPDLRASIGWSADALGRLLYDSVHEKLLPLPDDTVVYPGHGAGSMCGKQIGEDTISTIGIQRRYNYALQPMSREAFVRIVTADQPEAPAYFSHDAVLNRQKRQTLDNALERTLQPIGLDAALRLQRTGAQVLDVREPADYAGAHLCGSVNIPLNGKYATWAGTLLDPDTDLVIVADPGGEEEAAVRLGRIGFDRVAGFLDGGMDTVGSRTELLCRTARIAAATLAELLTDRPPVVVDVRTEKEWRAQRIEGSLNIPLSRLPETWSEVPTGTVVVHCGSGYRSTVATSLLARNGRTDLFDLVGGLAAWKAAGLPVVRSP